MAVSFSPSPDGGTEIKLKKVIEELHSEFEEHEQSNRNLEEKFLVCQPMTYTLVNQFQKYENGAEEESGTEQKLLAPRLRKAAQEEKEILQDSLHEGKKTSSSPSESSDIHQPPCVSDGLLEYHDNGGNDDENSLDSSLSGELQEEKENDLMLDKKYFLPICHPNSSDSQELLRRSVFPSDEPEVSSAGDEAKLNLDASIPMKNLAKIECDALKGSFDNTCGFQEHVFNDAANVWKQKIIQRKLLFAKWRMACRFPGLQTSELDSDDRPGMKNSPKLEGDAMDSSFANKNGYHVIGHIDDYTALTEQIGEGKQLVQKILSLLRPTCNFLGFEAQSSEAPGNMYFHELRSSICALHHTLEESASLLTMFWGAALPSFHGPGLPGKVDESMERELLGLRAQLSKQEKLLQSTAERLKTANQQNKNMEQFIISQLTKTHDVLKKARTNLELRKRLHLTQSQSLLQIHHHLSSDL